MNVDTIYDGEKTCNNIISSPVSVYVYIPTNVEGIIINTNGTIISVNSYITISDFTILCQFTMTSNNIVFNVRVLVEA